MDAALSVRNFQAGSSADPQAAAAERRRRERGRGGSAAPAPGAMRTRGPPAAGVRRGAGFGSGRPGLGLGRGCPGPAGEGEGGRGGRPRAGPEGDWGPGEEPRGLAGAGASEADRATAEEAALPEDIRRFGEGAGPGPQGPGAAAAPPPGAKGAGTSVLERVLIADFFFILACLLGLAAGVLQKVRTGDESLYLLWAQLFEPVVQPALGVFMLGALASGVQGKLREGAEDRDDGGSA